MFRLELREPPVELEKDITSEILEPVSGESREFLSSLIALWVKVVSDRQEWYCPLALCGTHDSLPSPSFSPRSASSLLMSSSYTSVDNS